GFSYRVQHRVPQAGKEISVPIISKDIARRHSPGLCIVIEIPFNIGIGTGASAQPGNDRRHVTRRCNIGDATEVQRGGKEISPAWNNRVAKRWLGKVFLPDKPGKPLSRCLSASLVWRSIFAHIGAWHGMKSLQK